MQLPPEAPAPQRLPVPGPRRVRVEMATAMSTPPPVATAVDRPSSPVPDEILRVFQWYATGPMPLAITGHNLRPAHQALGIEVSGAQLATALARYDARRTGRLELAEFRTLIEQIRPLDEVLRICAPPPPQPCRRRRSRHATARPRPAALASCATRDSRARGCI